MQGQVTEYFNNNGALLEDLVVKRLMNCFYSEPREQVTDIRTQMRLATKRALKEERWRGKICSTRGSVRRQEGEDPGGKREQEQYGCYGFVSERCSALGSSSSSEKASKNFTEEASANSPHEKKSERGGSEPQKNLNHQTERKAIRKEKGIEETGHKARYKFVVVSNINEGKSLLTVDKSGVVDGLREYFDQGYQMLSMSEAKGRVAKIANLLRVGDTVGLDDCALYKYADGPHGCVFLPIGDQSVFFAKALLAKPGKLLCDDFCRVVRWQRGRISSAFVSVRTRPGVFMQFMKWETR